MNEILSKLESIEKYARLSSKRMLTVEELSLLYGFSVGHIYRLKCASEIPFYKRGKYVYFDKNEIEEWLRQNRNTTIDEAHDQAKEIWAKYSHKGARK